MFDVLVVYGYFFVYLEGNDFVVLYYGDDLSGFFGVVGLFVFDGGLGGVFGMEWLWFLFFC